MLTLNKALLRFLNDLWPDSHQTLLSAKQDPISYNAFFANRAASSFEQFGDLDLTNLRVLDVGCGLGANFHYLNTALGAHSVTGIDISFSQVACAQNIMTERYPAVKNDVQLLAADAAKMPFADSSFDVLIAADTFEHVDALAEALQECARVLKPGGVLYAYFPPFYAPWGAHMINWIKIPWCQLFFSESTLLDTARRLEEEGKTINSKLPPETRLDLQSGQTIPFINHLTISRFRRLVHDIPEWKIVRETLSPPNWRNGRWTSRVLGVLNQLPLLHEVLTAKVFYVMEKLEETSLVKNN